MDFSSDWRDFVFNRTIMGQTMTIFRPATMQRYLEVLTFASAPSMACFVVYLLMVNFGLKWWKKNMKPMELRTVMPIYNLLLVIANAYCCLEFYRSFTRAEHLYSKKTDLELKAAYTLYWATKFIELLDTVFMMLRHKFNQISFLHVFHHSTMVLLADIGRNEYPWPAFAFPLVLNSFVHVFLYLYYAASAAAIEVPLNLKKSLTIMQITQFVLDMVFAVNGLLNHGFCVWSLVYGSMMLQQFTSFYISRYVKGSPTKKKKE